MSELTNPLFDDQREFLERQKEEYKNALLSDVATLKDQSQQVGKKLLVAGGFLTGIFFISRAIGRKRDGSPKKKKKSNRLAASAKFKGAEDRDWISSIPDVEDDEPLYSAIERSYPAVYHPQTGTLSAAGYKSDKEDSMLKSFFKSDLFRVLEQQLAAIVMIYLTKLIEQQMTSAHEEQPLLAESGTTEVVEYHVEPVPIVLDAEPTQP